ncbi:FAD-dependent oxidoreductase [Neorhizobium galegae]|uniref:FAD-dependent oxidoreductase n=1 Tax=Neorhizobium galegae TaxID=399 RepID=UPI002105C8C3|nr:NAD(P)/FAD-dependent oxidoreductase [Neorhizobium galegae]MCQ1851042.1 FAD-dependent monooxygenase [Neorhizobium galegae]
MSKLKVIIAGAGLGGLCLAQILRRADVEVEIFESDSGPWDRPQGYRLHIDRDGVNALREVLPANLYRLFEATAMRPLPFTTIVDTTLKELRRIPSGGHDRTPRHWLADGGPEHINVNRATLRHILLTGLQDFCRFGARMVRYETDAEGVTAVFADGSTARGDILVGADGIRSAVRRQRLPEARIMDTGVRAIYGRIPIEKARHHLPEHVLADVFTVASDDRRVFLGLGPVIFPTRPDAASDRIAPEAGLFGQDDYVVCIVGGRREYFPGDDAMLRQAGSPALQALAIRMLEEWPAAAGAIPAQGDPSSFFSIEMHTSVPCDLGETSRVTLLGDAIHAMTPTLGRGANVAMRDAALLGHAIIAVERGEVGLALALTAYEREMAGYGFGVVRESAFIGQGLMGQDPLAA